MPSRISRVNDRLLLPVSDLIDRIYDVLSATTERGRIRSRTRGKKPLDIDRNKRDVRQFRSERRNALTHLPSFAALFLHDWISATLSVSIAYGMRERATNLVVVIQENVGGSYHASVEPRSRQL